MWPHACGQVNGAAPSPMKNSRPGRDEETPAPGPVIPGLDQWTNLLPGGTLPAGVTVPDFGAAASAVAGIVTMPPNLPTAFPTGMPTALPPGFPTGVPNINDIVNSLPGMNP
ncbi:uncharacterized protein LOC125947593 isoform X2 [Dermacentor silvarum]|uniref:uncharacterized protein LOC125947593 isoform X2 n=1 Tax=Dermacentor silvarum TaxID=543639 RepID=UPI0021015F26|nr:uncharacterized protein LOC125947593 isoform X2 [Dermacentor silvarum]